MSELPIDSGAAAPPLSMPTRPFLWSVRRELWENRSIYLIPLIVAALVFFGFLISTLAGRHLVGIQNPDALAQPYVIAEGMLMAAMLLVGIFYSVDALHSERTDRSILFWKSLPVSDTTVVLSKAAIPIILLPLLTFAITLATQIMMLLINSAALIASGRSAGILWTTIPWPSMWFGLLEHLLMVHGIGWAPLFAWLLFVSGAARRVPFVWAVLPIVGIPIVEKMAFRTSHFVGLLEAVL